MCKERTRARRIAFSRLPHQALTGRSSSGKISAPHLQKEGGGSRFRLRLPQGWIVAWTRPSGLFGVFEERGTGNADRHTDKGRCCELSTRYALHV